MSTRTPTIQSVIDDLLSTIESHRSQEKMCMARSQEHAYKLVMETGPGWGCDQETKARNHLKECARDGGRANVYNHAAGYLEPILRDLCLVRDRMAAAGRIVKPDQSAESLTESPAS